MFKSKTILFFILTISILLRFYKLGGIPISINWDEASNSYNAYSILKTARDEYGTFLPLTNRSFDDYKPPLYMYFDVPAVAIFGLNNFSARLPSAVAGVLSVFAIYFLARRITKNEKTALLSMFFFAISPWNVLFSRVGFEANIGLLFTLVTLSLLLYAMPQEDQTLTLKNKMILFFAAVCAGLSLYSYHFVRIFLPIILISSAFIYKKRLFAFPKTVFLSSIIVGAIITLPLLIFLPKDALSKRFETTSLTAWLTDLKTSTDLITQDVSAGQKFSSIIHNRRVVIAQSYLQRYISHFDINFLFTTGDNNLRHHLREHGLLYLFQLPLVLFGIYKSVKNNSKNTIFLFAWLLAAPVPASFGDAFPHAIRSYLLLIPLTIYSALGCSAILEIIRFKKQFKVFLTLVIIWSFVNFLHNYLTHYNLDEYTWWQFGYKEAVQSTIKLKDAYDKVIIDPSFEQGYIFWLFYSGYDPKLYQLLGSRDHFDKFHFSNNFVLSSQNLYAYSADKFPADFNVLETIYDPQGKEIFKIGSPIQSY